MWDKTVIYATHTGLQLINYLRTFKKNHSMAIEKNQVVIVDYKLQNGGNEGDLIEETFGSEPLSFIFGIGK